MHLSGKAKFSDRPTYSDTKLYVLMLVKALSRKWPDVYANAVDPGGADQDGWGRGTG